MSWDKIEQMKDDIITNIKEVCNVADDIDNLIHQSVDDEVSRLIYTSEVLELAGVAQAIMWDDYIAMQVNATCKASDIIQTIKVAIYYYLLDEVRNDSYIAESIDNQDE
jgi:hypothetical protein